MKKEINDRLPLEDWQLEEMYDKMLNECYPEVEVAGYTFGVSHALERLNPTAYRRGLADFLDYEVSDDRLEEIDGEYYTKEDDETL